MRFLTRILNNILVTNQQNKRFSIYFKILLGKINDLSTSQNYLWFIATTIPKVLIGDIRYNQFDEN